MSYDKQLRLKSFKLIAEAMDLKPNAKILLFFTKEIK
ncbi:hypothetical protein FVB9532_03154 [Mesonia oceanica]|uniref:Uncharacterized protein n=1 Tax=Mesonia oceanica TaxID=2687242 RepID=A0AC61YC50_9FLAO|nr:hypothetical protein FVB9532_03154 [Mesonia oceanica]